MKNFEHFLPVLKLYLVIFDKKFQPKKYIKNFEKVEKLKIASSGFNAECGLAIINITLWPAVIQQ